MAKEKILFGYKIAVLKGGYVIVNIDKENILELICAAINDCEDKGMKHTSETLRAALQDLETLFELQTINVI